MVSAEEDDNQASADQDVGTMRGSKVYIKVNNGQWRRSQSEQLCESADRPDGPAGNLQSLTSRRIAI
jgi:hypothetical protein